MDRKILDYYPMFLQEIKEIKDLCTAQQPEIEEADERILKALDEFYIETASEYGVSRMEKLMGIRPPGEETLDERRFRIELCVGKFEIQTMRSVKKFLGNLLGKEGYSIELKNDSYTLVIRVALSSKQKLEDALEYVKGAAPANLVIDIDLKYNQHKNLRAFSHTQLKTKTHTQIRNEVL